MAPDALAAAIDVGSNTVHMLAARWRDGRVEPVDEEARMVGLGEDVYAGGTISAKRVAAAAEAVAALVQRARDHGASAFVLVATAAVRDAANADELCAAVRERAGLELQIIDGEREAALTYRGASAGEEAPCLQVCDVGGGSTEVIRAEDGRVVFATSLPIGSSRLSRSLRTDPPSGGDVAVVHGEAMRAITGLPEWRPDRLLVTGGTATALARVAGGDGRRYIMAADELARVRAILAEKPASEIAATYDIGRRRARLVPAGAAIIAALREVAGVNDLVLTAAGLRDGLLIEHFERGE